MAAEKLHPVEHLDRIVSILQAVGEQYGDTLPMALLLDLSQAKVHATTARLELGGEA